uniref:Cytochrome c5 n=1 Tax=Candidatus Kentrum sp. DK TaxID=2126562 RepID=A0A450SDL7_9GAMM|nr:MAG: Cytochrome c5 [Candidatus Kentron sp. DK]VFJ52207.1 MAG: Cytochrome c5 [Candidatus Kentron sp. DK]
MRRIIAIATGAVFLTVAVACTRTTAGQLLYDQQCSACHARGVAGAPIPGNKDAWARRIAKGIEALYASALNGLNTMPPRGGKVGATDEEIKAAVDYMVSRSQ